MRSSSRGLSLVEILLALALISLGIVFVLSILPTGVLTLQRAEDMQAATAYGLEVLDDAQVNGPTRAGRDLDFSITINRTQFKVTRDAMPVGDDLVDVVVNVRWSDAVPPLVLATRLPYSPAASPTP